MKEQAPIPTNWVSRDDLIYSHPDRKEQIEALEDSDIEYIAGKVGDALQETYWLAMDIVLSTYFEQEDASIADSASD
jgi:hypothetical protein